MTNPKQKAPALPALPALVSKVSVDLVTLQRTLCDAGLYRTAAAINQAANQLGWEAARMLEKTR